MDTYMAFKKHKKVIKKVGKRNEYTVVSWAYDQNKTHNY